MLANNSGPPPITPEELIKLKLQLDPNEFRRVEAPGAIVLVIRSGLDFPDIVNDIENISDDLELTDIQGLTDMCIIGNEEVIGVKVEVVTAMMAKRAEEDDKIVEDLRKKLDMDHGTLLFQSEHDPHNKLRLGIGVPLDVKTLKNGNLAELLANVELPARKANIIYIIAEDDYIRFNGKKFYSQLSESIAEQTPRTIEEEQDIQKHVLVGIADHFVEDKRKESGFQASITENSEKNEESLEIAEPEVPEPSSSPATLQEPELLPEPPDEPVFEEVDPAQALTQVKLKLNENGYEIADKVVEGVDIIAIPAGFEGRLPHDQQYFIKFLVVPELRDLIDFDKIVSKYNVKSGLVVTPNPTPEANIFSVGKNIEIVTLDEFEEEVKAL